MIFLDSSEVGEISCCGRRTGHEARSLAYPYGKKHLADVSVLETAESQSAHRPQCPLPQSLQQEFPAHHSPRISVACDALPVWVRGRWGLALTMITAIMILETIREYVVGKTTYQPSPSYSFVPWKRA